jgi:hypothetical protein
MNDHWTVWQRKILTGAWHPVAELEEEQAETMAAALRAGGHAAVAYPTEPYPTSAVEEAVAFGCLDAAYELLISLPRLGGFALGDKRAASQASPRALRPTTVRPRGSR